MKNFLVHKCLISHIMDTMINASAHSLVVSDLHSEIKGSQFESSCYQCAVIACSNCLTICKECGSGSEELKKCQNV